MAAPRRARLRAILDPQRLISFTFAALLLVGWQWAYETGHLNQFILPPSQIVAGAYEHFDLVWDGIQNTVWLAFRSLAIGGVVGVTLGLLCGINRATEDFVDPVVGMLYPVPKIALFPALAIWLGYTDTARILLVSLSCFYPVYVAAHSAAKGVEQEVIWVARNAGASRIRIFVSVIFPAATPRILVGLRIGLVVAFLVTVAVEFLTSGGEGVANVIYLAEQTAAYDLMWGAIFVFALVAVACDRLLLYAGRRATRGQLLSTSADGS